MSATTQPSGDAWLKTPRRVSYLAFASFICGVLTPVVGFAVLGDAGSNSSDLLTLTMPLFFISAVVLSGLAHWVIWKTPEQLIGPSFAKSGPILAAVTIVPIWLLIPAT